MKTNRNTFSMGTERIWVLREIDSWTNETSSKVEDVITFLQNTLALAKEAGYEDAHVMPEYVEQDPEENHGYGLIVVRGWRLETDEEYRRRLDNILWYVKRGKEMWKNKQAYYTDGHYDTRVSSLENAIESLRVKK